MSLQWKLILQRINLKNSILIIFGILFVLIFFWLDDSPCEIENILITNDISTYEKSLDPEFCELVMEKIDSFNDSCNPQIEILDCG